MNALPKLSLLLLWPGTHHRKVDFLTVLLREALLDSESASLQHWDFSSGPLHKDQRPPLPLHTHLSSHCLYTLPGFGESQVFISTGPTYQSPQPSQISAQRLCVQYSDITHGWVSRSITSRPSGLPEIFWQHSDISNPLCHYLFDFRLGSLLDTGLSYLVIYFNLSPSLYSSKTKQNKSPPINSKNEANPVLNVYLVWSAY